MSPPVPEPISEETLREWEWSARRELVLPWMNRVLPLIFRLRYVEQENARFGARISLLSTLAIRALAEGWTLVQYERELTRLDALRETP